MKAKLFIIQDSVNSLWYWAYHTKNFVIESKRNYKTSKVCNTKALKFALSKIDSFELFVANTEYKRV